MKILGKRFILNQYRTQENNKEFQKMQISVLYGFPLSYGNILVLVKLRIDCVLEHGLASTFIRNKKS